jgi:hypothetical protein
VPKEVIPAGGWPGGVGKVPPGPKLIQRISVRLPVGAAVGTPLVRESVV